MASKGDNVAVCNMKLERLLSMKGGKGQDSYANNSQAQVSTIGFLHLPMILIRKLLVVQFSLYLE